MSTAADADRPAPAEVITAVSEILVLAHSDPALDRAQQLFADADRVRVVHTGAGARGALRAVRACAGRPHVLYLIDVGISTTIAAVAGRVLGAVVFIDTGDLAYELARSTGSKGATGRALVWIG